MEEGLWYILMHEESLLVFLMKSYLTPRYGQTRAEAWNAVRTMALHVNGQGFTEFDLCVQGPFNREALVNCIRPIGGGNWLHQKVEWIRAWIRDLNTTENELKTFLKWVRGSSSLPQTRKSIDVDSWIGGNVSPIPQTHTCFSKIDIAEHPYGNPPAQEYASEAAAYNTQAGFTQLLKNALGGTLEFNGM
jgi:hypothetical protein